MGISDYYSSESELQEGEGSVKWESPSNLAVVKYWGKHGNQLPQNPSISITLSEAVTHTQIQYEYLKDRTGLDLTFLFDGKPNLAFKNRIEKFLTGLSDFFSFLPNSKLIIDSHNSFPHSSGIASSAASMSALALCLCSMEKDLVKSENTTNQSFLKKASFIARLGSGSACRSVYPEFALWGKSEYYDSSSDLFAVPVQQYHPVFSTLRNDILIVSKKEKAVSSSAGHSLMETNLYRHVRFNQAKERIGSLQSILENGDVWRFGTLLESEALTLHALMMASDPSYLLMEPHTISVINTIRAFRSETKVPVFFSLDAGPNVHIISYEEHRKTISSLLGELAQYSPDNQILNDRIGQGPKKIIS